jgi:hypothetical protein
MLSSSIVNDTGSIKRYPAWWVAKFAKDSNSFKQLLMVRALYPRIKEVLGDQWIMEVMGSHDDVVFHDEMGAFIECWENQQEMLRKPERMLDLQEAYDQMGSMLYQFCPLWEDNREQVDGKPTVFNDRPESQRKKDAELVETLKIEFEAFRVFAGLDDQSTQLVLAHLASLVPVPEASSSRKRASESRKRRRSS